MNTLNVSYRIKRISAISVGIILLSICGQSISSAYQYPVLTSHHKFRIFVSHKSAVKAPVVAALRALPAKASPLANLDPATVVLVPITPVLASGSTTITEGDLTPTFTPSYSIPSTITLPRSPVCDVIEAPGVTHLGAGTFHADCSFASPALPASISYDDIGAGITYVYTFTYPQVTITVNAAATHNVLFDDGFGNIVATEPFVNGASVVAPADPTHAGYTFNGWSETLNGSAVSFPYTAASFADVTLHALWTLIPTAPTAWTLTANNASYTIGGSMPTLSSVANPSGAILGSASCGVYAVADSGYATPLAWHSLPAGAYVIRCTGTPASGYAVATLVNGSLTVSNPSSTPIVVTHSVSYNLAGGAGKVPSAITAPVGTGYTVASNAGLSKDGFLFGGWSDGFQVIPAGSLKSVGNTDIVLTAIWNATPTGSGEAAPIVLPKTPVVAPVAQVFTNHAVASNLVANFAKIVDITFKSTLVPVAHDAGTSLRLTDGVQASLLDQLNLVLTPVGVQVTAVKGWTGRISFPVVATQSGKDVELFVGVEEDPAPALVPIFNLLSTKQAKISWTVNNSQVELYNIYLGNRLACTTSKNTCSLPINSISNFKSALKIESVGHQATYSTKVAPAYSLKSLVSAGIVYFDLGSAALKKSAKKTLAALVVTLKALGVTNVNLNGHADATGLDAVNKRLSVSRANAVKAYLAKALPKL